MTSLRLAVRSFAPSVIQCLEKRRDVVPVQVLHERRVGGVDGDDAVVLQDLERVAGVPAAIRVARLDRPLNVLDGRCPAAFGDDPQGDRWNWRRSAGFIWNRTHFSVSDMSMLMS
jgi:hypothetical protein